MGSIIHKLESYEIMGACFEVYKEKGCGFLEAVYQECLEIELALQRQFESFPFFEFFEAAFTMGLIGLVIAQLMIAHEFQNVLRFPFRIGQSPFD
jgi:hypothetical protein